MAYSDRPVFVTEQYPEGLGSTAEEIALALPESAEKFEKTRFSALGAAGLADRLETSGNGSVVVCGLETHICVLQTALGLLEAGFTVHLLTDCVASRFLHDKTAGVQRMISAGVISSSLEMALFEMMEDATHPKFKEIQQLIK